MSTTPDTTRRTLAQARQMPQWQRLMKSVNDAQAAKGWPGRHFSAEDARRFGETYIGKPVEKINLRTMKAHDFAAYWVARQEHELSDGSHGVRYVLRAVYGDDLADIHTIAETGYSTEAVNPSAEWEARTAAEFIRRAQHQAGFTPTPEALAADKLPVSAWAEFRRDIMTPQTIAHNHAAHVSDTAHALRKALDAYENPEAERTPTDAELVAAGRALLAAIGEGE